MFITLETRPSIGLRPEHSKISRSDWDVLADYWYPVAIAATVGSDPVSVKLLDMELVLYRSAPDHITCAVDICPHRHIHLSGGRVEAGQIVCPFHGLRFDGEGQCKQVPALGRDAKLPAGYRVKTFPTRERFGLLWTCIGDAEKYDLPAFPALEGVEPSDLAFATPYIWPISAPRQVENFVDLAHLPLVHANTLGGDPTRALKPGRIEETNDAVILHANYVESNRDGSDRPSTFRYRVVLPFAVDFTTAADADPDHAMKSVNIPSPTSAHESLVFQITLMPGSTDEQKQGLITMLDRVNQEDIVMLRGLATADMPLDHKHEIHLPVDNICHAYRKRLRDLGLGR